MNIKPAKQSSWGLLGVVADSLGKQTLAQKIVLWASLGSWSPCWGHMGTTDDSNSCVLCDQNWGEKKKAQSSFTEHSCDRLETL